jgi:hypothetical protein
VIDPDTATATKVHVYVDDQFKGEFTAGSSRPDVGGAFPGYGPSHGFDVTIPTHVGFQRVVVYAINVGPGTHAPLRAEMVVVGGHPFGSFDSAVGVTGGVRVAGWAIDRDTASATKVHVYVDDTFRAELDANGSRPDVGAVFPAYGANHGFVGVVSAGPGNHNVCVYAINVGWGDHQLLSCRSARVL